MLVKDYVIERFNELGFGLSDETLSAEMGLVGLVDTDIVSEENNLKVYRLLYNVIPFVLLQPKSVKEGGYSITFDKDYLLTYYRFLCKRLGLKNELEVNPTVEDITEQW